MNDQSMNKKTIVFVSDYLTTLEMRLTGNFTVLYNRFNTHKLKLKIACYLLLLNTQDNENAL